MREGGGNTYDGDDIGSLECDDTEFGLAVFRELGSVSLNGIGRNADELSRGVGTFQ